MSAQPARRRSRRIVLLAAVTAAMLAPAAAHASTNPNAPGQLKKAAVEAPADGGGAVGTLGLSWL
jgi:hypothetical protein